VRGILPNKTKQKLARGEVVLGCALGYPDPELVELMGVVGLDYVRVEGEHGPVTYTELEHLVRAAELFGVTPGARVGANVPHEILHYLDRGVQLVTVPNVGTRADAEAAVRAAKHFPIGQRGHNGGGRPGRYGWEPLSTREYYDQLNEQTMLVALIESKEGLENAAAIAGTPGIDAIDIGPSDLAQSLGLPEQRVVDEAVDRIVDAAMAAGKPVGVGNAYDLARPERARRYVERGCTLFLITAGALFRRGAGESVRVLAEIAKEVRGG
jgi:2-keto-3-deoxy-L-rhamnonate aldolase RhmA